MPKDWVARAGRMTSHLGKGNGQVGEVGREVGGFSRSERGLGARGESKMTEPKPVCTRVSIVGCI